MRLILGGVLLCLLKAASGAGWFSDLISPEGWHLGDGLTLHLADSRRPNSTFLERHSIMMDYGGYGVSVAKVPRRRAVEVGLYTKVGEERGFKTSSAMNIMIGYKIATVVALAFSAIGAFVLKALISSKIAAITSAFLLLTKLFHHEEPTTEHIEIGHPPELYPVYASGEYYPTGSGTYYSYADFPGIDFAAAEPSGGNSSLPGTPGNQQVGAARRRDGTKRKRVPMFMIHQYSVNS